MICCDWLKAKDRRAIKAILTRQTTSMAALPMIKHGLRGRLVRTIATAGGRTGIVEADPEWFKCSAIVIMFRALSVGTNGPSGLHATLHVATAVRFERDAATAACAKGNQTKHDRVVGWHAQRVDIRVGNFQLIRQQRTI